METLTYTEKTFIIKEDFKIAAKTWGNPNGKPILALHGWLDNANTFDKIAAHLHQDLYLVAIDLPGHGLSDHKKSNSSYYLWEYAIQVLNLIDVLKWKTFSIIAHSLGTGIASIIAGSFPEKLTNLVCIDGLGAPFITNEDQTVINFRKAVRQSKMADKTNFISFNDTNTAQFESEEEAIQDRIKNNHVGQISIEASKILCKRSLKKEASGYAWRYDPRVMLLKPFRLTENQAKLFIKSIKCTTLLILGEEGMFGFGLFNDRIQEFQFATVHWLPGGHHLHLEEASEKITLLINQFLNKN